jgi:hypothetical protein
VKTPPPKKKPLLDRQKLPLMCVILVRVKNLSSEERGHKMKPVRMEALLKSGRQLIAELRNGLSEQRETSPDPNELVGLIQGLQLFWSRADDLQLKWVARCSLALEQFLESLLAKGFMATIEYVGEMKLAILCLEQMLAELDATGDDPHCPDWESLHRLEHHPLHEQSIPNSETPQKTIEVFAVREIPVPPAGDSDSIPQRLNLTQPTRRSHSEPSVEFLRISQNKAVFPQQPQLDLKQEARVLLVQNAGLLPEVEPASTAIALTSTAVPLNRILVVEGSLFYRHLIQLALQSVGYEVESVAPTASDFLGMTVASLACYPAILLTAEITQETAAKIEQARKTSSVNLIGLQGTDQSERFPLECDAFARKTKPQLLITLLDELQNPTTEAARKTA